MSRHEYLFTCDSCGRTALCTSETITPLDYEIAGLYELPYLPTPDRFDSPRTFVLCRECAPIPYTITADGDSLLAAV
jgi:hypothetical protein